MIFNKNQKLISNSKLFSSSVYSLINEKKDNFFIKTQEGELFKLITVKNKKKVIFFSKIGIIKINIY